MRGFLLSGNGRPMTDQEWQQAQASIASNHPTDLGSGLSSIAQALMYRANKNGKFPAAPGATPLSGLFSLGAAKGGGLY